MDVVNEIIEYENGNPKTSQVLELFSKLIKSGSCWILKGSYGRTAKEFIDGGIISKEGVINWDAVEDAQGSYHLDK